MSIIIFIVILSILVFVHELGHFLFAKWNGIRVDEFAIGFPPRVFSFKKGETKYSINLLPLGGYVKIFGENPDEDSINGPDKDRSFVNKGKLAQASVLIAGILFNILFAWVLFTGSFLVGVVNIDPNGTGEGKLFVTDVLKDSPAEIAGIKAGDVLISLADSKGVAENLSPESVRYFVGNSDGQEVTVSVERGGDFLDLRAIPTKAITANEFVIGVSMAEIIEMKLPIHKAIWEGLKTTIVVVKETAVGIVQFLGNIVMGNGNFKDVAGPVGIAGIVGEASKFGFGYILSFAALISINLAIINLIPFPALDGGRLLFVAIETITRRPINTKFANILNLTGFVLLLLLMVLVTVSDIRKLF